MHKVVNGASTENFDKKPRNIEHINAVMTDLDGVDKKMGEGMDGFVNLWSLLAEDKRQTFGEIDTAQYVIEMRREVEEKRKVLVEWTSKIRAGK